MSSKYYLNWEEDDTNWDTEVRLWEEVYIIIGELVPEIGGGRNPFEDEQIAALKEQLENLDKKKADKLIEVMILLGNKEYKEKKKKNENIKLKVDDIKTIARDYLKIEIG